MRQSTLDKSASDPSYKIELDSTFDARWLGGGATQPRWDVEGKWIYFQYSFDPKPVVAGNVEDPWWRVSRDGKKVERVERKDALLIPANVGYTRDGSRAVYFIRGELRYWKRGAAPRLLVGKDFEFVTYPVDQHGWQTKWARRDSQRRVTRLWEDTILRTGERAATGGREP